jgi:hypothetical protein
MVLEAAVVGLVDLFVTLREMHMGRLYPTNYEKKSSLYRQ